VRRPGFCGFLLSFSSFCSKHKNIFLLLWKKASLKEVYDVHADDIILARSQSTSDEIIRATGIPTQNLWR